MPRFFPNFVFQAVDKRQSPKGTKAIRRDAQETWSRMSGVITADQIQDDPGKSQFAVTTAARLLLLLKRGIESRRKQCPCRRDGWVRRHRHQPRTPKTKR